MTDIVQHLRGELPNNGTKDLLQEAAEEIARLRESCIKIALDKDVIIERLRAQVKTLSDDLRLAWRREDAEIARRVLEPKP